MEYVRILTFIALSALLLPGGGPARAETPDPLLEALAHDNHKVRIKAAKKLARVPGPDAQQALVGAAADEHPLVRAAAAHSLGQRPSSASIGALCGLIGDPDDFVRRTATRALERLGGPAGCPAWLRLEITGDTEEMQARVRADMLARFADDPAVRLTDAVPETVSKGKVRGYELKLRLARDVQRTADEVSVACSITQAIFDLRQRSLRGSATQRGSLKLQATAPDAVVTAQIGACMDALSPVVHRGMSDFLARSRR